jgi:DNA-binding transcriptional LysR family regulator
VTFDLNLLKNEKLFITKPGQNLTQILYQTFSRLKFSPNNVMEIENMTTAINLVSANMGFTFIPEAGTKYGLLPSNIQLFTIDNPTLKWQLVAIYKKNGYLTKIAQLFIDELKSFYSESI